MHQLEISRDEKDFGTTSHSRRTPELNSISEDCDYRLLCDLSLAGIYVSQHDQIVYANAALAELLGCEREELLGQSFLSFVQAEERADVALILHQCLQTGPMSNRFETCCIRSDGGAADVEILVSQVEYNYQPALIGTMLENTDRNRARSAMVERLQYERLLADLSASFVNLPADQIGPQIQTSLKTLVEFLGNDRSTLVEFGDDEQHVLVTHSYAMEGCEPFPPGKLSVERLPWFIGQFRSGNMVFLRNLPDELPPEAVDERQYCLKHGVQSNVTLPLMAGGLVLGGLTFAFIRSKCDWHEEVVTRLRLLGEVFANALLRRRADESLQAALLENRKLQQQLAQENQYLRQQVVLKYRHGRIIGRSDAIVRVLGDAERVAVTDAQVLLLGETGTGKELLAQTIHELSKRNSRTMVIVNCASLPATLIESELFGREAGAYTGAASAQVGRFTVADRSTLFLDEVAELPIDLQAKLLRVLEDGRFERLGSPKTISVDVRIIAATNRDLSKCVQDGTFRADLYHRLNVFPIRIPPLRERRDDIPPLVWAFVETMGKRMGKSIKNIPRRTMQQLQQYSWPGNIRELSNVVERAMILANDDTLSITLPAEILGAGQVTLKDNEREYILRVLEGTGWRIRGCGGAAELLGIKPTTLEARMARIGIRRPTRDKDSKMS